MVLPVFSKTDALLKKDGKVTREEFQKAMWIHFNEKYGSAPGKLTQYMAQAETAKEEFRKFHNNSVASSNVFDTTQAALLQARVDYCERQVADAEKVMASVYRPNRDTLISRSEALFDMYCGPADKGSKIKTLNKNEFNKLKTENNL